MFCESNRELDLRRQANKNYFKDSSVDETEQKQKINTLQQLVFKQNENTCDRCYKINAVPVHTTEHNASVINDHISDVLKLANSQC